MIQLFIDYLRFSITPFNPFYRYSLVQIRYISVKTEYGKKFLFLEGKSTASGGSVPIVIKQWIKYVQQWFYFMILHNLFSKSDDCPYNKWYGTLDIMRSICSKIDHQSTDLLNSLCTFMVIISFWTTFLFINLPNTYLCILLFFAWYLSLHITYLCMILFFA